MGRNVLILTDHSNHSSENSLYALSVKMLEHSKTSSIDIATRANSKNDEFFACKKDSKLWATRINDSFGYDGQNHPLLQEFHEIDLNNYDLIWLRLPPPLSPNFLNFIADVFEGTVVINNPKSIHQTGSKRFLVNFPTISPPMRVCSSLEEINEFRKQFPIVLKPFNEYGGRGILKIDGEFVTSGTIIYPYARFQEEYVKNPIEYLGVKFLKNVSQGDKRIVVVNGEVLGASLRLPAENSWMCNVSMGGSSNMSEVQPEEKAMVAQINPLLSEMGIVMYGIDTLVNDDGKRVLSEINTTSIGGLPQIAAMRNEPLVDRAIDLIWDYYEEKTSTNG